MAQKTRAQLNTANTALFTANGNKDITGPKEKAYNEDVNDSFLSKGGDNLTGALLFAQGSSKASAATVDLSTATGNNITITGTASITSFGTIQAGAIFVLTFSGAATLIYNVSSMILPGGFSRTMEAGDVFVMQSLGSGNWKCIGYALASGQAIVGNTSGLAPTLAVSNSTSGNDIDVSDGDSIVVASGAKLRNGSLNNGFGGGISQECAVGFEQEWENGVQYYFHLGSQVVHANSINGAVPDASFDNTKNFTVNSTYTLLNTGATYKCIDATTDAAVWVPYSGEWEPTFSVHAFDSATNVKSVYEVVGGRALFQTHFLVYNVVVPESVGRVVISTPPGFDMATGDITSCVGVWSSLIGLIQSATSDIRVQLDGSGGIQIRIDSGSIPGQPVYEFTISGSYQLA